MLNLGSLGVVASLFAVVYVWRSITQREASPKASQEQVTCVVLHPHKRADRGAKMALFLPSEADVRGMAKGVARRVDECKAAWTQLNRQFPDFSFEDLVERHRGKVIKKLLGELEASVDTFKAGNWSVSALCPELSEEELKKPEALDKLLATVCAKKPLQDLSEFFLLQVNSDSKLIERESEVQKLRDRTEQFLGTLRHICVASYALQLTKRCHDKVDDWSAWLNWQLVVSTVLPALLMVGVAYYQQLLG